MGRGGAAPLAPLWTGRHCKLKLYKITIHIKHLTLTSCIFISQKRYAYNDTIKLVFV